MCGYGGYVAWQATLEHLLSRTHCFSGSCACIVGNTVLYANGLHCQCKLLKSMVTFQNLIKTGPSILWVHGMVISSHPGTSTHLCECCRGVFWSKQRTRLLHISAACFWQNFHKDPGASGRLIFHQCLATIVQDDSAFSRLAGHKCVPSCDVVQNHHRLTREAL